MYIYIYIYITIKTERIVKIPPTCVYQGSIIS